MTICVLLFPEFMLQVTAVKATTWKAARTRSLVCGPMPITRVKLPVSTWRGDMAYKGNILHNITHFMNMDFIGFGDNRMQGEVLEYGSLQKICISALY